MMAIVQLLEQTNPDGSTSWFHCSEGGDHYVLRDFQGGDRRIPKNELVDKPVRFAEVAPWLLETTGRRISHLSVTRDRDAWREVLAALEEREPFYEDDTTAPVSGRPRTVPKTALRHLYEHLRDFPAIEIHRQKCQRICAGSDAESNLLDELFGSSLRELESYCNDSEPFHARKAPTWRARFRGQTDRFAHWVVAQVAPQHAGSFEIEHIASRIRAVDYELYTLRTTGGAVFPDGTQVRHGGSGGLDLLLDWGGIPVVGEVKARGDTNAFLALVSDGTKRPRLYEDAKALARQLMALPRGRITQHVRFIAFVNGRPGESNELHLSQDQCFES